MSIFLFPREEISKIGFNLADVPLPPSISESKSTKSNKEKEEESKKSKKKKKKKKGSKRHDSPVENNGDDQEESLVWFVNEFS